jgi:protein-disulfide isomerase
MKIKIDADTLTGVLVGALVASVFLNAYFLIRTTDPDVFPTLADRFFLAGPELQPSDHVIGDPTARIIVFEFADYQCAYCRETNKLFHQIVNEYPEVAWVKRHRPLQVNRYSEIASEAVECAAEQDEFWPYNDELYRRQDELNEPTIFVEIAESVGLTRDQFLECFRTAKYARKITADLLSAKSRGISRTPTFYIGRQRFDGVMAMEELRATIEALIQNQKEFK